MRPHSGNGHNREGGVETLMHEANDRFRQGIAQYEEKVRREPMKSVFFAVVFGCLLRSLPVAALAGGVVRLMLALVRPAALLFVSLKLVEAMRPNARRVQRAELDTAPFPR